MLKKCIISLLTVALGIAVLTFPSCASSNEYTGDFSAQLHLALTSYNPKVQKIVVQFDGEIEPESVDKDTFVVNAGFNKAELKDAYVCDANGAKTSSSSKYVAFDTVVSSTMDVMKTTDKTRWADSYRVSVRLADGKTVKIGKTIYDTLSVKYNAINDRVCAELNGYEKDSFTYQSDKDGDVTLQRSLYTPEGALSDGGKNPMIVWLHGYGEGGTDIEIPMLNSNAVSLSSPAVQAYFNTETQKGAYVAFVQAPTMWMDTDGKGNYALEVYTGDGQPSFYTEALAAAIDGLVSDNPDIDAQRIYIAGCSNGGYMAIQLALTYQNKYAAYVPICEAYMNGNLTDEALESIKDLNIWFIHSDDDATVDPYGYTVPTYYRLIEMGAENVEFTFVTGYGHGSWGAFFSDSVKTGFDLDKVKADYPNLEWEEEGFLARKEYYVCHKNCIEEKGSVFAWLAKQSND